MERILIYQDNGQWYQSADFTYQWLKSQLGNIYKIEFTNAKDILENRVLNKTNVVALFITGGHSRFYFQSLGYQGVKLIQDFIASGRHYFGICGGAYFASNSIRFKGDTLELNSEQTLKLVNINTYGSIREICKGNLFSNCIYSSKAVKVNTPSINECYVYYWGGPCFINHPEKSVLGYYTEHNLPALLQSFYGAGTCNLISFHPEYNSKSFARLIKQNKSKPLHCSYLRKLSRKLKLSEVTGDKLELDKLILKPLL